MIRFRPDTKQLCVLALAPALALVSLMVPIDDGKPGPGSAMPSGEHLAHGG